MHISHARAFVAGLVLVGALGTYAAAPASPQGVITAKVFLDIGTGTTIADLTGNAKFPDQPDIVSYPTYFEMYATGDITTPPASDVYNGAGGQIIGYFYPPTTGDYTFYICSDDLSNLYLSPDADPANKKLIAQETAWSNPRTYLDVGSGSGGSIEAKCSVTFTGTEWAVKDPSGGARITLTAGRPYYIEALFKEGTGGDNLSVSTDAYQPIDGAYLSSYDKTTGPVSITTQPQSQTVNEGGSVTFSVGVNGTPPYTYQWFKGATELTNGPSASITIDRVTAADNNAKFKVVVTGAQGTATSAEATLTVVADATAPTLVSARSSTAFTTVTVTFSEPMEAASAQLASNYKVSGGISVTSAVLGAAPNDNRVVLTTSQQTEGATYTLTVSNVKDLAGNTIAANTAAEFNSFVFLTGYALHSKYDNVDDGTGGTPGNLFADPRYPGAADRMDLMTRFEYPADGAGRVAADPVRNYFDAVEGFFIPPTSGNYVFFLAGADRFWLYLSTDADPANKHLIAAEPGGWSDARGWLQMYSGTLENRRSDQYLGTEWPNGNTITLTAGQRYFVSLVHHDPSWCGGDFYGATFIKQGEADPANATAPALTGSVIGTYVDPTGSSVTITEQPANATQEVGRTAVFTVVATGTSAYGGSVTYQWQKQAPGSSTWTDIAGATSASYETPTLLLADTNTKYRVLCKVPAVTQPSDAATLTVVADAVPPKLVSAGAVPSQSGATFDVGISFDEKLDAVSAGTPSNYTLSAGTVSAAKYYVGTPGVVLTVSGLVAGNSYTVTVVNVKDIAGNAMTSSAKTFAVSGMKWGVVGGDELGLGNGVVALSGTSFDVYSDGIGEWASYDEATFVYEQVTGDFDKVVRVEYQDASSQWARAGLIARDVTNFGVDRSAQEGGAAGRYQKVHVNPVTTAMGTAGNNAWEGNRRLDAGGGTTSAATVNPGAPQYPTAWCRLKRAGDLFTIFASNNGIDWTQLGTTTFTEPMPATLYVGPEYSPENGNIGADTGLRGMFVAKFRDYGNYSAVVTPTVTVSASGVITYTGVLQSATTVNGSYAPVPGAVSPYTMPQTGAATFYRTASQ